MQIVAYFKEHYHEPPLKTILIVIGSLVGLLLFYWLCILLTCLYSILLLQIGCEHNPAIFCGCSSDSLTFYGTYFFAGVFSLAFTIIWVSVVIGILCGIYYLIKLIVKLCWICYQKNKGVIFFTKSGDTVLPT